MDSYPYGPYSGGGGGGSGGGGSQHLLTLDGVSPTELKSYPSLSSGYGSSGGTQYLMPSSGGSPDGNWYGAAETSNIHILQNGEILRKVDAGKEFVGRLLLIYDGHRQQPLEEEEEELPGRPAASSSSSLVTICMWESVLLLRVYK